MKPIAIMCAIFCAIATGITKGQETNYNPGKVVYDLDSGDAKVVNDILDRVGELQKIYNNDVMDASIIVVIHGAAIPLFTHSKKNIDHRIIQRAHSHSMGDIIKFRVCRMSARMQGYKDRNFPNFISLVPMADAELVQLQQDGYAYIK